MPHILPNSGLCDHNSVSCKLMSTSSFYVVHVRNSKQIVWSFALAADWVISPIIIESRDRRSFYLFFYNPKDTFTDPFNPPGASPKRSSDMSELSVPGKVRLNVPPYEQLSFVGLFYHAPLVHLLASSTHRNISVTSRVVYPRCTCACQPWI